MNGEIPFPTRVLLYFARMPDEELTTSDLAQKFDFPQRQVANSLGRRRDLGMLKSAVVDRSTGELVWSAGPLLRRECGLEPA